MTFSTRDVTAASNACIFLGEMCLQKQGETLSHALVETFLPLTFPRPCTQSLTGAHSTLQRRMRFRHLLWAAERHLELGAPDPRSPHGLTAQRRAMDQGFGSLTLQMGQCYSAAPAHLPFWGYLQ